MDGICTECSDWHTGFAWRSYNRLVRRDHWSPCFFFYQLFQVSMRLKDNFFFLDFDHDSYFRWANLFWSDACLFSRYQLIGGLATVVASYLARARGSNEPELSNMRVKDLDQFVRECEAFKMDHGHVLGNKHDRELENFRLRFEELLGNMSG